MSYITERFRRFCGFVTGMVFFVSGIVKLLDPVGAGLVMDEYFQFMHLCFLSFTAKLAGTAFAFAEAIIGTALITGVWRRSTGIAALAFQGFFTLLTLALVIFNPEMDCGCFGEAIHLTHMQTFIKNLILIALLCIAFFPSDNLGVPKKRKIVSFGIVTMAVMAFTIYSWMYIPMTDFTDFKPGAELAAGNTSSEDMYEAVFIYEKDGKQESFDLENLPDSSWTFVSAETILKKGMTPPVSLSFTDTDGIYRDSNAAYGKVMTISFYDTDVKNGRWIRTARFIQNAEEAGFRVLILAADTPDHMAGILAGIPADDAETLSRVLYYSDYKSLITLNRSNGGATYFHDGVLIRKWAQRALPDKEKMNEIAGEHGIETSIDKDTKGSLAFQGFLLYVFAVMLLL